MAKFSLKNSEQVRNSITERQQKEIYNMYYQIYQDVSKKIQRYGKDMRIQNLLLLKRNIVYHMKQISQDIKDGVVTNMNIIAEAVVEDARTFLKYCGFKDSDIHNAFEYVPNQIVDAIVTGNVYQDGWTLSKAIWGSQKRIQDNLDRIIAIGTKQGKSAYEVAQDIEQYVLPSASKPSHTISSWRYATSVDVSAGRAKSSGEKIYDTFYFGRVDYNAQRLARTLISHAYQQSFMQVNENDPFVVGYRWLTSNFHGRVCKVCRDRATQNRYGLGVGVFPKDQLPLDHPNGMCTFEAVMSDSMLSISDKIARWYNSPSGTYPDIDRYALDFVR